MEWKYYGSEKPKHGDIVILRALGGRMALVEIDTRTFYDKVHWDSVGFSGYEWDWDFDEDDVVSWALIEKP